MDQWITSMAKISVDSLLGNLQSQSTKTLGILKQIDLKTDNNVRKASMLNTSLDSEEEEELLADKPKGIFDFMLPKESMESEPAQQKFGNIMSQQDYAAIKNPPGQEDDAPGGAPGGAPGALVAAGGGAAVLSTMMGSDNTSPGGGDANKLAQAASELKGTSTKAGPNGGREACVYAVNMVYKKAGLTPPWGTALRVSNAESAMINAGYTEVAISARKPGDIIIIYDNHPNEPQIHIGVVLTNGNMLSNSTRRGSFVWEDSPENQFKEYGAGARGKCYRMPGGALQTKPQQTNIAQAQAKPAPSASTSPTALQPAPAAAPTPPPSYLPDPSKSLGANLRDLTSSTINTPRPSSASTYQQGLS